jgi:hypothetical protein
LSNISEVDVADEVESLDFFRDPLLVADVGSLQVHLPPGEPR